MDDVASSVQVDTLSSVFSAATTCSKRPNCDGVHCNAVGSFTSDVIIDPCQESVRILLRNTSSSSIVFDQLFPQSAEYPLPIHVYGLNAKLSVGIVHRNFSMKLSVSCDCIVISCATVGASDCGQSNRRNVEARPPYVPVVKYILSRICILTIIFVLSRIYMLSQHPIDSFSGY